MQHKVNEFLAVFWDDPVKGITEFPVIAGGLAGGFIVFFVLLGLLFSLLTPAKKVIIAILSFELKRCGRVEAAGEAVRAFYM